MKNKAQTSFFITLAMCVLLLLLLYMYWFTAKVAETESLEASNATLQARVKQLEEYYKNMPTYKEQIASWQNTINEKLAAFPADSKEEDSIYMALKSWENEILVAYTSIGVGEREVVDVISADIVKPAAMDGFDGDIVFKERMTTYNNLTTYTDLKNLIAMINDNPEQLSITNMVYSMNEEGLLEGSLDVTYYMVDGTGKEYQPREFKDYPVPAEGEIRNNLFGYSITDTPEDEEEVSVPVPEQSTEEQ